MEKTRWGEKQKAIPIDFSVNVTVPDLLKGKVTDDYS